MKHIKNSLVVFAVVLVAIGVITSLVPSLTKGQKTSDVPKSAFNIVTNEDVLIAPDPEGPSYAITSFTVTNGASTPARTQLSALFGTPDCGVAQSFSAGPQVRVLPGETVHLVFPQPWVFSAKPGLNSCLRVDLPGPPIEFSIVGYKF
jgi:hypothetical protein